MGNLCGKHCLGRLVCNQALCQVAQRIGPSIAGAGVLHQANDFACNAVCVTSASQISLMGC